ncbi:hypothetical protein SAMN05428988_0722 [Chitinophaga sp. YR573]|uniref:beta strand repeat-containing protein n=1 Tax=Chitinophaga sp. YR573 TaxID=1881040 RepID=UPI0008BE6E27|nr:hypothetical protein [Chitinophaga sp. YR573]SEV95019.1 hypothetical protein SAMN05428988_0722 [Chitinophaga sp. YR573]
MKAVIRNVSRTLIMAGAISLVAAAANAQMKIGTNPSVIKKSAILDLETTKQGLLLPRLPDFTAINAAIGTDIVDGMIVYLASGVTATEGVYMRKAGAWVKISSAADAVTSWSLLGNTGTTAANYVGTTDAMPLSLRSNATEGISIQTDGTVQLKQVAASATLFDVMVIDPTTGTVSKRTLPITAFNSLLSNVAVKADSAFATMNVTEDATTKAITINTPIMAASSTAPYGFITKADWDKLQSLAAGNNFTIADFITTITAGQENRGGQITYNAATASYKLELVAASATLAGIVTTTAQTFGGDKTFTGAVAVGGTLGVTGATTLNSTLDVTGNTTVGGTLGVTGAATLANNLSVAGTSTLTGATTVGSTLGVTGATTLNSTLNVVGASTLGGAVTLGSVAATPTAASYDLLVKNTATNTVEKKAFNLDALSTAVQFITTGGATASTSGTSVEFQGGTTGTDFNIVADGTAKTVTFNIPDASALDATHTAAQRGLVTTTAQTFGGSKAFASKVAVGATDTSSSTFQVTGSVAMSIKPVTAAYTITDADNTILANATGGGFTVTLPAPSSTAGTGNVGRIYTIKKIGTGDIDNPITIVSAGGANIEGGTTYMIYNDWTFITVQTDGTAWYIVKK